MELRINSTDVTELVITVGGSGSKKECARTLTANILQSPTDTNIPVVPINEGDTVAFNSDGYVFDGIITEIVRTSDSNKLTITAKDNGIFLKDKKVTLKVKDKTPAAAAQAVAEAADVALGDMVTGSISISRKFTDVNAYDAIMAGYILDAEKTGKQYYMAIDGGRVCVRERGKVVAGVVTGEESIMQATFSVARQNTETKRKATVTCTGNGEAITGNAIMVEESYTGLYGLFFIEDDKHTWQRGYYTCKLTLAWENTMDAKAAGEVLKEGRSRRASASSDEKTEEKDTLIYLLG